MMNESRILALIFALLLLPFHTTSVSAQAPELGIGVGLAQLTADEMESAEMGPVFNARLVSTGNSFGGGFGVDYGRLPIEGIEEQIHVLDLHALVRYVATDQPVRPFVGLRAGWVRHSATPESVKIEASGSSVGLFTGVRLVRPGWTGELEAAALRMSLEEEEVNGLSLFDLGTEGWRFQVLLRLGGLLGPLFGG